MLGFTGEKWTLNQFYELAVTLLEVSGTLAIVIGAAAATYLFLRNAWRTSFALAYPAFRSTLGRSILLGLEFLVAADILQSLVIAPTLDDLMILAGLVLVRTFLSISLGVEINGHWPWQDTRLEREQQALEKNNTPQRPTSTGVQSAEP